MSKSEYVTFTAAKLQAFKVAYREAVHAGMESFVFQGREYLTRYAKYVIEHLEGRLA